MEVINFCNPIMEVTSHYFCCILLVRSKSLYAAHTQGEGNCTWIGIQGTEVIKGQLRTLPPFSSVQFSRSVVSDFVTPWTTAHQASLSITNSRSPPKPMSTVLVMPSNHLIICHPLLLLPSIFPSIRVFSNESVLRIRWRIGVSASTSVPPMNTQDWSPLGWTGWISL